jgi:hypothetical protein
LRSSAYKIARERDAIAIAARDLQDRLVAVRDEDCRGREARDRGLAGRRIREIDRVDLAFQLVGPCLSFVPAAESGGTISAVMTNCFAAILFLRFDIASAPAAIP